MGARETSSCFTECVVQNVQVFCIDYSQGGEIQSDFRDQQTYNRLIAQVGEPSHNGGGECAQNEPIPFEHLFKWNDHKPVVNQPQIKIRVRFLFLDGFSRGRLDLV